jgi:putative transposase
MINRSHDLPLSRQAQLMQVSRGSIYYRRKPPCSKQEQVMRSLDALHVAHPFAGSRMLRGLLRRQGHCIGRRQVRTLMRRMCISALYCKPRTSVRHPQNKIYPYLLRSKTVTHSNQVWAMDITYVRMHKGWLYLCAVVDWYSRKVLAWRLSNTMDAQFCVDAVQAAIARWGTPAIFNTDQGSQFTCDAFTGLLQHHGIRISMDGKGAWRDNVFVERLWRSIKYEEIYLKAYDCVRAARSGITQYLQFYNSQRPHQAHSQATPDEAYFAALPFAQMQAA